MGSTLYYNYFNVIAFNKIGRYVKFPENILECNVIDIEYEYLLFLKFDNKTSYSIPDLDELIESLKVLYSKIESPFIILTPRKEAPILTQSEDEFVYSFSCKISLFNKLIKNLQHINNISSTQLLFELLDHLISKELVNEDILVRQMPITIDYEGSPTSGDVIIPHRGEDEFLQKVLLSLTHVDGLSIYVGIDQEISETLHEIIDRFPFVNFYSVDPNPVGPYVIRNRLIDLSSQDLQFFHDSDDISCRDRFEKISKHMIENNCEFCGSHELRLDYYSRVVQSIRFPKDVSQALKSVPWFPLQHPTSAINRSSFYKCGKLSEERTFANDTKFMLISLFYIHKINNVDEFLYIRRIHPNALTTAEETKLGSKERLELHFRWSTDFQLIKIGLLELNASSLMSVPTGLEFQIFRVPK